MLWLYYHAIEEAIMTKYGPRAQKKMKKVMEEFKQGKLTSGNSKTPVKSRKQAVVIGLSEARKEGDIVPPVPK
jgi:hypothetical protein